MSTRANLGCVLASSPFLGVSFMGEFNECIRTAFEPVLTKSGWLSAIVGDMRVWNATLRDSGLFEPEVRYD